MGKNQHVTPKDGMWQVKSAGNSHATSIHQTQQQAIKAAQSIAKNQKSELFIHNREGQIRERNSYGNDPYPPRG